MHAPADNGHRLGDAVHRHDLIRVEDRLQVEGDPFRAVRRRSCGDENDLRRELATSTGTQFDLDGVGVDDGSTASDEFNAVPLQVAFDQLTFLDDDDAFAVHEVLDRHPFPQR